MSAVPEDKKIDTTEELKTSKAPTGEEAVTTSTLPQVPKAPQALTEGKSATTPTLPTGGQISTDGEAVTTPKFSYDDEQKDSTKIEIKTTNASSMLFIAVALLYELLFLAFQFIYTVVESFYRTIVPVPKKSLAAEIILVTGGGHGIGKETCFLYAEENATVVIWDVNQEGMEETKKELNARGYHKVHIYKVDVSDQQAVESTAEKVRAEVGDVTILVNNAGILPCRPLEDHTPELIEKIYKVNVLAHFWTIRAFLPKMLEKDHGHIVAMSSFCGIVGLANAVPYCSSKFAVRGLMEALSEEIRLSNGKKPNIHFTTIYPIMVNTGLVKNPRNRFPFLLKLQAQEKVASVIVDSIRRNYKEVSIPVPMLTIDRISRLLPEKFTQYCRDFLDTGLDPDNK